MTSTLDPTGLTIEPQNQIVQDLVGSFQTIYGADVNVDSNSPDGQLINIIAQLVSDLLELLLDTYNSCAIPTSYGTRLDQLVALNGIQRKQGTYTQRYVSVTATQALTLPGMDQTSQTPFTVKDNAGNQYQILTSYSFGGSGTQSLLFQSVSIGAVQSLVNTITNIVTPIFGITSVNNPSLALDIVGVNEETDAQLRVRHSKSLALASTGPADSVQAALLNVPGIVDAYVVENNTGAPVNGVPANSIWCIVNGGTALTVAGAIYAKKAPGCGMKGGMSQAILRPNGQTFTAQWDAALSQNLYVGFSLLWRGPVAMANADIQTALASALVYKLGQNPSIGDVVAAMATIAPTAIVTINSNTQGVSKDDANWFSQVLPTDPQHYYVLPAANVVIT